MINFSNFFKVLLLSSGNKEIFILTFHIFNLDISSEYYKYFKTIIQIYALWIILVLYRYYYKCNHDIILTLKNKCLDIIKDVLFLLWYYHNCIYNIYNTKIIHSVYIWMIVLKHLKYSDDVSRLKMHIVKKMNISLLTEILQKSFKTLENFKNLFF